MIKDFIEYLKVEKRASVHTVKSYQNDLEQALMYLNDEFEVDSIQNVSSVMLRSWTVSLINSGLEPKSVSRKISSLKAYYKYLLIKKIILKNPAKHLISPKTKKSLPTFVEESKMELLNNYIHFEDDFEGVRAQLILELLYQTGIRLSELINLKENNIEDSSIKVLGKRNKERIIPVSAHLKQLIGQFLVLRNKELNIDHSYLLCTNKGEKLYEKFVYRLVNTYLGKVTSLKKKSPHVLRHTFATHMLNAGADLNAIKELLGHSSLAATQVYTHNNIEKLKQIYNQTHPKSES